MLSSLHQIEGQSDISDDSPVACDLTDVNNGDPCNDGVGCGDDMGLILI